MDVDQLARVFAVQAEALAIHARIAGMAADNAACNAKREPPKWVGEDFDVEAAALFHCSASLRMMGGS